MNADSMSTNVSPGGDVSDQRPFASDPEYPRALLKFYGDRQTHFTGLLDEAKKRINIISNLRIATAIAIIGFLYGGFSYTVLFYAAIPFIVCFVILVLRHVRLFARKVHLQNLVNINEAEAKGLSGDNSNFSAGSGFIDAHHPYTHDLDIFGEGSLYQRINRCNTHDGRESMARLLAQPHATPEVIREYQKAVIELTSNVNFRQDLQAVGTEINEQPDDRQQLLAWLTAPTIVYGKTFMKTVIWLLPALTVATWMVYLTGILPGIKVVAYLLVLTQWIIWGLHSKQINVFHDYISRKKAILEKYAAMLSVIRNESTEPHHASARETPNGATQMRNTAHAHDSINTGFQTSLLKAIVDQAKDAGKKVDRLAVLVNQLNARTNFMMAAFVNSFLLYDVRCVYRLEKWRADNGEKLSAWLKAVSDAEVLGSLANFTFNHPHCRFPVIHNEWAIRAEDMGHPLIDPATCVTNSVNIGPAPTVLIVTGANMAGKSTFLRSIGVNLVLALCGAPVYARSFACPVIPLRSGMRTADSLKDHESYFYAELNRLKSIMDELRQGKPLFILLDEILKGTNSNDKQKGSIALVQQLLNYPSLCIVATHDLALGELSAVHPSTVHSYCFEANIEGDQLSFDYKLKPGLAKTMNATFLMRKMGIIGR